MYDVHYIKIKIFPCRQLSCGLVGIDHTMHVGEMRFFFTNMKKTNKAFLHESITYITCQPKLMSQPDETRAMERKMGPFSAPLNLP